MAEALSTIAGVNDQSKEGKLFGSTLSETPPPELAERIFDTSTNKTYKRGKLLGIGGFARVYEMTDMKTDEVFAGKVIPKSRLTKAQQTEKLMKEIELHRSLTHNNIVSFHSYFEDEQNSYIMLEYCPRKSLFQVLRKKERLEEDEVRFFMQQLAEGVRYMHEQREIVHRDLKLGNLLLSQDMVLKIADFGLAAFLEKGKPLNTSVCGTPNYIAPEVLNAQDHGFPADIWSMGCIMYALLVGQPPFESPTLKETYARINNNMYSVPEYVSLPARRLINAMLQKSPSVRPSASQVLSYDFFTGTVSRYLAFRHDSANLCKPGEKLHTHRSAPVVSIETEHLQHMNYSLPALHLHCKLDTSFYNYGDEINKTKFSLKSKLASIFTRSPGANKKQPQEIQKKLESCLRILPKVEYTPSRHKPSKNDMTFITKWMDYSNKYGFGYQLSNGSVGVMFLDGCCLKLSPNKKYLKCIWTSGKKAKILTRNLLDVLHCRFTILQHFMRYMEEHLVEGAAMSNPTRWKRVSSTYLDKWFRTDHAVLMHLSNGTIQVNFSDHTKLVFEGSSRGKILFVDAEKKMTVHTFREIKKYGCARTVHIRLRTAANIIQSFLEKEERKTS